MTTNQYKIIVAYDGSDFFGWQAQKEVVSVAGTLQNIFERVFNKKIKLAGASRTDAGVHAMGQVAVFYTDLVIDTDKMLRGWSNILPPTIVIRSLEKVEKFNPYRNVVAKTYWYHFFLERPTPFTQRFGWHYRYSVDIEKLQESLNVFLGTHDFKAFCSDDERGDDTIRHIEKIEVQWLPEYAAYRISITGPKFLRYMIRRIVGAAIEVASRNHLGPHDIKRVLAAKNPEHLLPNAPAKGLVLYTIEYKNEGVIHE